MLLPSNPAAVTGLSRRRTTTTSSSRDNGNPPPAAAATTRTITTTSDDNEATTVKNSHVNDVNHRNDDAYKPPLEANHNRQQKQDHH